MTQGATKTSHSAAGERIVRLRKRAGLSQDNFAPLVGITRRHLSRLENGHNKPSRKLAARIEALVEERTGNAVPFSVLDEADAPFHAEGKRRGHAVARDRSRDGQGGSLEDGGLTDEQREQSGSWCKFHGANLDRKGRTTIEFAQAIRDGELERQPCEVCGAEKAVGHHEDYAEPLEVVWLCRLHHAQRHKGATLEVMRERLATA